MSASRETAAPAARPGEPVAGPSAWHGPDMARRADWVRRLCESEVAELERAVDALERRGLELPEIGHGDVELPTLGPVLEALRREVVRGRGFVLLRGLPVERYTRRQAALAYWAIGTRFGWAVPQNAQGHLLGHVKDLGNDPADPQVRIYTTRARQPYHTDSCDVVALLCLQTARRGGASTIASAPAIHNALLAERPDLVGVLARPFVVDRKGEVPAGKAPTYEMPVFHYHAGHLTTVYARDFIEAAQHRPGVPRLTAAQVEALDAVDALAASADIRLDMDFRPGDVQLLHNHQVLHARTAYEDWPEPARRRHLLRLWLSPPDARPLPAVFAERYGTVEPGPRRGGIRVPGQRLSAPLEAA